MQICLNELIPRIVPSVAFAVRAYRGKRDMLKRLPSRLQGYASWIEWCRLGVVVVIDRDDDQCVAVKQDVEQKVPRRLGLFSPKRDLAGHVLCRVACEELESWFFGDVKAISGAYPKVPVTLGQKRAYRDPDAVGGGTWEALERVLQLAGYFPGGLSKIELARAVAPRMDIANNTSVSFSCFRDGLTQLVARL